MSGPVGGGWWQASDGRWYQSAVPPGPGWWMAGDGNWYPPQIAPTGHAPAPPYAMVPQPYSAPATYSPTTPSNSAAKTGGVVGIVGAALSLIPFLGIIIGLIMGVIAIVFSSIGLSRSSQLPDGKGMATAGLVLGILTVIFKLIPGINVL